MTVHLLREPHAGPGHRPLPLTWWVRRRLPDGARIVWAVCGKGHAAALEDHEVADDGTVTPSLACPEEGCGWHENVRLEGWPP